MARMHIVLALCLSMFVTFGAPAFAQASEPIRLEVLDDDPLHTPQGLGDYWTGKTEWLAGSQFVPAQTGPRYVLRFRAYLVIEGQEYDAIDVTHLADWSVDESRASFNPVFTAPGVLEIDSKIRSVDAYATLGVFRSKETVNFISLEALALGRLLHERAAAQEANELNGAQEPQAAPAQAPAAPDPALRANVEYILNHLSQSLDRMFSTISRFAPAHTHNRDAEKPRHAASEK